MRERTRRIPGESQLVRRARADGARAARVGQYDEWSFDDNAVVPYLEQLSSECAQAIAVERVRYSERLQAVHAAEHAEDGRRGQARARADAARTRARQRMERDARARDRSEVELDLLTGVHDPLPAAEDGSGPVVRPRGRWAGPADGTLAPPIPLWFKLPLVALLAVVEVPIYFAMFRTFHYSDLALTWCFTVPVALSMVLGPHLAGLCLRWRLARPALGVPLVITCVVVMAVWFGAAGVLGYLRSLTLLAPTVVEGVEIAGTASRFGGSTLLAVFALVILLSGFISFLLGMADHHPTVAGYNAAARRADRSERGYYAAISRHADASLDVDAARADSAADIGTQHVHRLEAIRADFDAARQAYLDELSLIVANPTMTHATGTRARVESPT
jgi:hypothetical protein